MKAAFECQGFVVWPRQIGAGRTTPVPAVTSDYLSTIIDFLGVEYPDDRPLDGVSLRGVLAGSQEHRGRGIGFQHSQQMSWVTSRRLRKPHDIIRGVP